jgi:hypothetical protein
VVWQEWNGRAGVQFADVPRSSRRLLDEFLAANVSNISTREATDQSIELQDPLPIALSMSEPRHADANPDVRPSQEQPQTAHLDVATAVLDSKPEPNNRRAQARYACRLGAEVYRTGTSVPNRCCLTDLSAGGCYLEMPLPFPQGATVEIVVRTYEMKLRVRGSVLASHPGFGMGIGFDLKAKDERANIKKLTDFVAETTEPS